MHPKCIACCVTFLFLAYNPVFLTRNACHIITETFIIRSSRRLVIPSYVHSSKCFSMICFFFCAVRFTQTDMTPLILAASAGREKVVNTLLTEGANVNATTDNGHSALQYAASKNWVSICELLLDKGADVNIADKRGATPLHRSASKGNIAIVKLLLEYGKKLNIGNVSR